MGAGTVVVCGTTIGANAFVGAGTVVAKDVPAHAFLVGNPGRRIGWACTCGERLVQDLTCPECGRLFAPDDRDAALGGLREISPGSSSAAPTPAD